MGEMTVTSPNEMQSGQYDMNLDVQRVLSMNDLNERISEGWNLPNGLRVSIRGGTSGDWRCVEIKAPSVVKRRKEKHDDIIIFFNFFSTVVLTARDFQFLWPCRVVPDGQKRTE